MENITDFFYDHQSILLAFGLTILAGLSTGIGSALAFFAKRTNTKFLSLALGFSAGVMIYVSFVEIFFKAREILTVEHGDASGYLITIVAFFTGMIVIAAIDKFVPAFQNPHEIRKVEAISEQVSALERNSKLYRLGVFSAIAIAIHNFPEGLATFLAALHDVSLGIPIAIAIALHNIPEGVAISVPIYQATGSKRKAFILSFLSGLAEPLGALIGFLLIAPIVTPTLFGFLFASVAGIMVFISLDNLLPTAREYGEPHLAIYGLMAGMAFMAFSLFFLAL